MIGKSYENIGILDLLYQRIHRVLLSLKKIVAVFPLRFTAGVTDRNRPVSCGAWSHMINKFRAQSERECISTVRYTGKKHSEINSVPANRIKFRHTGLSKKSGNMGGTRMKRFTKSLVGAVAAAAFVFSATAPATAKVGFGKPGEKVDLVIGYQPYYTESWSGVVINGKDLWKKHLPKGSTAKFEIGLQGSVIVGKLLGEKNHIGYMGDMPAIVSSMREKQVDLRMISVLGTSKQQCNIFLVPNNAPKFKTGLDAVKWMNGKLIAAPHGACTDRFARLAFQQAGIQPSKYLNQNIENITKNLEAGKISGAAIWEPTASKIEMLGIARRAATGADFKGDDAGDAGFLVMMNEIIQDRPDVHRGWLEAELDAQIFLADKGNANAVAQMADDQTEGMDRKILWASLYHDEKGAEKLTLDFVFNDKVKTMLKASANFLAGQKKFGNRTELRAESVWDEMARKVLADRGLKSPIGVINGVPLSQYKP